MRGGDKRQRTAELRYDPLGRLYEIGDGTGNIQRLLYDGLDLVGEFTSSGAMIGRYVHGVSGGDDPMIAFNGAAADRSDAEYLYADRLGTITAGFDRLGALDTINTYDEFGVPGATGSSRNTGRFRYTGQVYIPEIGLYHYKARAYSPGLGRFLQADPIGYGDGLNMYGYVGNDPTNSIDPLGLQEGPPPPPILPPDTCKPPQCRVISAPGIVVTADRWTSIFPGQLATLGIFNLGDGLVVPTPNLGPAGGPEIVVRGRRPASFQLASKQYIGPVLCGGATVGRPNAWNPNGRVNSGSQAGPHQAIRDLEAVAALNGVPTLAGQMLTESHKNMAMNSPIPVVIGGGWYIFYNYFSGQLINQHTTGLALRIPGRGTEPVRVDIPAGFLLPSGQRLQYNETCHYR